jgi:hypothetical protein
MIVLLGEGDAFVVVFHDPIDRSALMQISTGDTPILHRVNDQVLKNSDPIALVTSHCRQRPDGLW